MNHAEMSRRITLQNHKNQMSWEESHSVELNLNLRVLRVPHKDLGVLYHLSLAMSLINDLVFCFARISLGATLKVSSYTSNSAAFAELLGNAQEAQQNLSD